MFSVEKLDNDLVKKIETEVVANLVKISAKDGSEKFCVMPQKFVDQDLERIKNMEIFEDDVWVITYSKCGTTWSQEMAWMLNSNLDYKTANKVKLDTRFPFLEWSGIWENFNFDSFETCKNQARPRYIKSHLPVFLLPDQLWTVKPKIVYVARNPKDVAVSFYHHHCHLQMYSGTKKDFISAFAKDFFIYSPFNDHVLEFWKIRNNLNILFLFYEDMKKNLDQEVKNTIKFFGKNYSQKEVDKLCHHLSFDSMKNNLMVNRSDDPDDPNEFNFMRKGQVGGYKEELTLEENDMLDKYMKDSKFEEFGFEYKLK